MTDSNDPIRCLLAAWDAWVARPLSYDVTVGKLGDELVAAFEAIRVPSPRVWTQREIDELTSVCWHCGDVLQGLGTHCEHCPAPGDCDDKDCEECARRKAVSK